ncbi:MAG: peptidase S10 [Acidobacteriota bacterium]|nr:peptidase S10 [Acidobacteriota bacterium]
MFALFILSFFLFFQTSPTTTAQQTPPRPAPIPSIAEFLNTPTAETKHSIRAGGRQLNYTVTTGFMPLHNGQTGETEAKIFYIAYTLDDRNASANKSNRPLMFSFNGGPGSASVWLHLGALGPKRVKMLDDGLMPPPPYQLVDNEQTWLTETDLVFIDPVGTGYSRATKPELASKFFSVNGDIESVGEFIRLYLGRSERWSSPIFLVGESYGTARAAGLSNHLFERGIGLNGILLVSSVLNFQTIRFAEGNDVTYPLIFPSYTATAWYHKRLPANLQSKPLRQVLDESENWAIKEYAPALVRSDRMSASEKQALLEKFSNYSGLNKIFVEQNNYRINLGAFNKELLRDERRTTGRLDSRFTGIDRNAATDNPETDPSMNAIRPPYTATFNDYVRRDLGFRSDLEYYILGGGINAPWNYNVSQGYANTAANLQSAMQKNPFMKIFVASGFYDMATPYFATEYTLAAMNLDSTLRKNISVSYYEAGHMMYIEKNSLRKLKEDATVFIQKSIQK